jgi:hypothetical protein
LSEENSRRFDGRRVRVLTRIVRLAARAYDVAQKTQGKSGDVTGIADELAEVIDSMIPKETENSQKLLDFGDPKP